MAADMVDIATYLVGAGGVIGITITARIYTKFKGLQTALNVVEQAVGTITTTAQGLESSLAFERSERERERVDCAKEIARLEGQIQVLTSGFVDKLIDAVKSKATEA